MGDILHKATVIAIGHDGKPGKSRVYTALLDTGAGATVIPARILRELRHKPLKGQSTYLNGMRFPCALISIHLHADSCEPRTVIAAVADPLAKLGGPGVDFVIGHDYFQRAYTHLDYGTRHRVACRPVPYKHRRQKRHRR